MENKETNTVIHLIYPSKMPKNIIEMESEMLIHKGGVNFFIKGENLHNAIIYFGETEVATECNEFGHLNCIIPRFESVFKSVNSGCSNGYREKKFSGEYVCQVTVRKKGIVSNALSFTYKSDMDADLVQKMREMFDK